MSTLRFVPLASTLAVFAVVACSSSSSTPAGPDYTGACQILASRCHPVKTTLGQECHELGHDGDDAKCGPRKESCLAECPEGAGGEDGGTQQEDGGSTDAGSDAAADAADSGGGACATYCTCMAATCATEPGYPYANEAACLTACAAFDAKGVTCVAAACEKAKTAADKDHECEHAGSPTACH